MNIEIKALDYLSEDLLDEIIRTHIDSFKYGLSTNLGKKYLIYFYNRIAASCDSVFFCCFDENKKPCGFICGTIDSRKFYDLKHNLIILLHLFFSLLTFNFYPVNFLRAVIKRVRSFSCNIAPELLCLIVYPEKRRQGIGQKLVLALSGFFNQHDINKWKVLTDGELGHIFYSKLGLDKIMEFNFAGVKTCLFTATTKDIMR